ncbi:MAG: M20/M25/M40 family metallo-hydrolase [Thermoleophilaceae bacterium]
MDERSLTERLITYDTATHEGMHAAAAFIKGWLESHDVEVAGELHNGRPLLAATVGAESGPTVVLHGHLDVVPGNADQFQPRVDGDRLYGRGAYDMKGGLAAMMVATCQLARQGAVKVHFVCVSDEETNEDEGTRASDHVVERGYVGDFAITGEPTNLHIGVQAKGVLAMRIDVRGRSAHGSTPWLGDNAVLKAIDVFRGIESLAFTRESSDLFDRPSISLGRILGGDAMNRVPDHCALDVDIRYLPGQDPDEILGAIGALVGAELGHVFHREPIVVDRADPYVQMLAAAVADVTMLEQSKSIAVGRDGTSDIISFIKAGVPGVEFGPLGDGHHGPEEWVSIDSLGRYRNALVQFVESIPHHARERDLRIA